MLHKFFSWYTSTHVFWRRLIVAALVPVTEYLLLEPVRRGFITLARFSLHFAIASLLLAAVLTVGSISLFVYECYTGMGSRLKSKAAAYVFLACVFGWVILPLHFISMISDK